MGGYAGGGGGGGVRTEAATCLPCIYTLAFVLRRNTDFHFGGTFLLVWHVLSETALFSG